MHGVPDTLIIVVGLFVGFVLLVPVGAWLQAQIRGYRMKKQLRAREQKKRALERNAARSLRRAARVEEQDSTN